MCIKKNENNNNDTNIKKNSSSIRIRVQLMTNLEDSTHRHNIIKTSTILLAQRKQAVLKNILLFYKRGE